MSHVTSPTTPKVTLPNLPHMGDPIESSKTLSRTNSIDSFKSVAADTAADFSAKVTDKTATTLDAAATKTQPPAENSRLTKIHSSVVGFFKGIPHAVANVFYFILGLPQVAFEGVKSGWNWAVGGKSAKQLASDTQEAGKEVAADAKAGAARATDAAANKMDEAAQKAA